MSSTIISHNLIRSYTGSARRSHRKSTSVTESIDGLLKPTPRAESERSASSAANSHRHRYDNRDVHRHRDEDRENRAPREHRTKHHKPPVSEPLKSEAEVRSCLLFKINENSGAVVIINSLCSCLLMTGCFYTIEIILS